MSRTTYIAPLGRDSLAADTRGVVATCQDCGERFTRDSPFSLRCDRCHTRVKTAADDLAARQAAAASAASEADDRRMLAGLTAAAAIVAALVFGGFHLQRVRSQAAAEKSDVAARVEAWKASHCEKTPFGCLACTDSDFPAAAPSEAPAGRRAWRQLAAELGGADRIRAGARICR